VRGEGGRGLYVDTPVTNELGRSFYEALGYRQAYVVPEYYDEGFDGVTYLKLFPKREAPVREALFSQELRETV
jgi:ribosomal protein S18 acetylase RimI-like enzyme